MIPENTNLSAKDQQLDHLLARYRQSTEFGVVFPGDASPNFMPELWARIESRRSQSFVMDQVGRVFTTAALAMAVVAGLFAVLTPQRPAEDTWVEAIASHQLAQNANYYEPVRLTPAVEMIPAGKGTDH